MSSSQQSTLGTASSTTAGIGSPESVVKDAHTGGQPAPSSGAPADDAPSDLGPDGYPPQKHAGKVGYGPEYGKGAGFADKVGGMKEQLIGMMKHDEGMVEHGKDRQTGMVKVKALNDEGPFKSTGNKMDKESKEEAATV